MATGLCTNTPEACSKAASQERVAMPTPDAACPECGAPLNDPQPWRHWFEANRNEVLVGGGLMLVVIVGFGLLLVSGALNDGKAKADPFPQADERLRVSGDDLAGSLLAPPLAKAWLLARGASGIKTDKITDAKDEPQNRTQVSGRLGGKTVAVNITGGGTTAGLAELAASSVDVVIASRPITAGEAARGDLRGTTAGSLVAQGAVVVITARAGPANALTAGQLQGLFSGKTHNWAQVGGPRESVHLYGPREGTDVDSLFETAILRGAPAGSIKRFDDGAKEDAAVAADPAGIGFIAMPLARKTRAVAIVTAPGAGATSGAGAKIDSYPLSHPLWFYTAAKPANPQANAFVQFALSDAGQTVVKGVGYAGGARPPRVRPPPPVHHAKRKSSPPLDCPKDKVAMTDIGGARMTQPYDCTPLDR